MKKPQCVQVNHSSDSVGRGEQDRSVGAIEYDGKVHLVSLDILSLHPHRLICTGALLPPEETHRLYSSLIDAWGAEDACENCRNKVVVGVEKTPPLMAPSLRARDIKDILDSCSLPVQATEIVLRREYESLIHAHVAAFRELRNCASRLQSAQGEVEEAREELNNILREYE